ncbi:unnamed protein product, partial [Ectocarpus sp. 13 AM-2016]
MRHEITHPLDRFQSSITSRRCGATGTRGLLLHPAIVAGRGAAANDPDVLDDIELPQLQAPPPPPPPPPPQIPPPPVLGNPQPPAAGG